MTAQISENLIYEGEILAMCAEPLDFWLSDAGKHINFQMRSTACWRGYVGTWKIISNHLYLSRLYGYLEDGRRISRKDLFPKNPKGVFAHWFTEEVRCPMGELLNYEHMGYMSTYEKDLYLNFSNGILISKRVVVNGVGKDEAPKE